MTPSSRPSPTVCAASRSVHSGLIRLLGLSLAQAMRKRFLFIDLASGGDWAFSVPLRRHVFRVEHPIGSVRAHFGRLVTAGLRARVTQRVETMFQAMLLHAPDRTPAVANGPTRHVLIMPHSHDSTASFPLMALDARPNLGSSTGRSRLARHESRLTAGTDIHARCFTL